MGLTRLEKAQKKINPNIVDTISYISQKGVLRYYYLVKCTDCDFLYKVYSKLKCRKTCRHCKTKKTLIGKKFGRLKVIKLSHIDQTRNIANWECLCDCGNTKIVPTCRLRNTQTKSCGCYNIDSIKARCLGKPSKLIKVDNYSAKNKVFLTYKHNAGDRNLDFNLNFENFCSLILKNCFYCNSEPSSISRSTKSRSIIKYNGIDRINSKIGYNIENCLPCCKRCNSAKSNSSIGEFYDWIDRLVKYRNL